MIQLVERQQCLSANIFLASAMDQLYESYHQPFLFEVGERIIDEHKNSTILDASECQKLNDECMRVFNENRDDAKCEKIECIGTAVLHPINDREIENVIHVMAHGLNMLGKSLGVASWTLLMLAKGRWLDQKNSYPKAKAAYQFLEKCGVLSTFDGSFEVSEKDIEVLIEHLLWLTRCNASLSEVVIGAKDWKIIGVFCKHGHVHWSFGDQKQYRIFADKVAKLGLELLNECPGSGAPIEGREVLVEAANTGV